MDGKRKLTLLALAIGWGFGAAADAAPPWKPIVTFKKIDADPDNPYPVSEQNGPWMIMVTTFSGDRAMDDAKKLVHELRKDFKLPAYTLDKRFDYSKPEQGLGVDMYGNPKMMRHQKAEQIDQVAVLVGDFQSVDDGDAQKILARIKQSQPEALKQVTTNQTSTEFREAQQKNMTGKNQRRQKGPLGSAFITTNPLVPKEYFAPQGMDKLVVEMNKDVKYSLLNCTGRYTVKVATFKGNVVLDQTEIKEIQSGGKEMKSQLEKAALRAHTLTEALRKKGYEAYEFHDRQVSIVTVGSFDSVGTPRADGKTELNPKIHTIMKTFGGEEKTLKGDSVTPVNGGIEPKIVANIPLDIQPLPVEVPKRSLATDYQQTMRQ